MSLDQAQVTSIAKLAMIAIDEADKPALAEKLSSILDLFAQMEAVDTHGIEPMAHPLDQVQRLREDVVREIDQHQLYQSIAPSTEAGLYLVPQVIE